MRLLNQCGRVWAGCHAEGRGFESLDPLLLSQTALQIWDFDSCECREPRAATFCLHLESQARLVGWPANGRSYRITLRNKPATRSARLTVVRGRGESTTM